MRLVSGFLKKVIKPSDVTETLVHAEAREELQLLFRALMPLLLGGPPDEVFHDQGWMGLRFGKKTVLLEISSWKME